MVLRVAARAKVDARRLVRQAASSRDRVPATKPAVTATRASRPALRRDNVRLSGSIVAVGIALALWAADMQAQGDGGYKLVPNWVKMPGHVPAFGPGRKFLPPGEREADQDAKRKAGFIEMVEAQPGIGGIAVDSRDRVYVLQRRAELPIMVFDSTGEFLYGGGGDIFSRDSHFVQVDTEGNVWAVDRENQRIIKYNNALDRILMVLGTRGVPGCDAKHFNRPTDVARIEPTLALKAQ